MRPVENSANWAHNPCDGEKHMTDDQKPQEIPAAGGRQPIFMLPLVIAVLAGLMLAIQAAQAFVS